jgi:hypothetical protein
MSILQTQVETLFGAVGTMHVLNDGEIIDSLEAYEKVAGRFAWVSRSFIISRILALRQLTDPGKKSVIVLYEEGEAVREFLNVDPGFRPMAFY